MKTHSEVKRGPFVLVPIEFQSFHGAVRTDARLVCSYCGSLTVEDALKAFQTPGVRWSGSDWKYGWPHKFYLEIPCQPYRRCTSSGPAKGQLGYSDVSHEHYKFYAEHLIDATPEQLAEWNRVVKPLTGIGFEIVGDDLRYSAPCHGWQADGVIPPAAVPNSAEAGN